MQLLEEKTGLILDTSVYGVSAERKSNRPGPTTAGLAIRTAQLRFSQGLLCISGIWISAMQFNTRTHEGNTAVQLKRINV